MDTAKDAEIRLTRDKWRTTPASNDPWKDWSHLRDLLCARYQIKHNIADLREVIDTDQSLLISPKLKTLDIRSYAVRLQYLSIAYSDLHEATLEPVNLARATFFNRWALALLPPDFASIKATLHSQFALKLLWKADQKRDRELMDEAYEHASLALKLNTQHSGVAYEEQLSTLANVLRQRYLLSSNPEDLSRSIGFSEEQLRVTENDNSGVLHNLSYSLSIRYDVSGRREDLDRAIEMGTKSLENPDISLASLIDRSRNLVDFLKKRWDHLRDPRDLHTARTIMQDAVAQTPQTDPRFANIALSLVQLLRVLYDAKNRLEDLQDAISIGIRASAIKNVLLKTRRALGNELGLLLSNRLRRLKVLQDGPEALKHLQSALQTYQSHEASRTTVLTNIASVYDDMYIVTSNISYLQKAAQWSKASISHSNPQLNPGPWLNAANMHYRLFLTNKNDVENLSQAVSLVHRAFESAGKCSAGDWAQICLTAALLYREKHIISNDPEAFNSALTLSLECWNVFAAPINKRLNGANYAARILADSGRWPEAWQLLQEAVSLIQLYRESSLDQQDQIYAIRGVPDLTALACTAGLVVGETTKALQVWEKGRGLVIASSHKAIGDLSRLKFKHHELYTKFQLYRAALFEPSRPAVTQANSSLDRGYFERSSNQDAALSSFNQVIKEIQRKPGFEHFLQSMTAKRMKSLAGKGAIVLLNSSTYYLHAIIVTQLGIKTLELKDDSLIDDLFKSPKFYRGTTLSMTNLERNQRKKEISTVQKENSMRYGLYSLWGCIVKPVCDALGFTPERMLAKMKEEPPNVGACRIWWMTSGGFSRLPIHAAADLYAYEPILLVNRAISSYAASFRMLEYATMITSEIHDTGMKGLVVSMERPTGDSREQPRKMFLKSANEERGLIQNLPADMEWTSLIRPSAQQVLQALPNFSFVHFATHGLSDSEDPLKSHLVLSTGAQVSESLAVQSISTMAPDNLFMRDIFHCTTDRGFLAVLTACNTADIPEARLADENLHIVNAFQVAGYPHVIGTLWPSNSGVCPDFAQAFYSELWKSTKSVPLSNDLIAWAAHRAITSLFSEYLAEPTMWACFIHTGP